MSVRLRAQPAIKSVRENTNAGGGSAYDFEILQDGIEPGDALDAAEEDWIRAGGGRKKEGGRLANVGNPISEERYTEAGGLFPGDSGC